MRCRLPAVLLVLLLAACACFILVTSGALPERVASHFDGAGTANGAMTREGYRNFMLLFALGLPLLMIALIAWLPRLMPNQTNILNRGYWLAPERRAATFAVLSAYALWLGCLLTIFMGAIHWLLLRANAVNPPRLENTAFLLLLAAFAAVLALWIVMLVRRFRVVS